MEILSETAHWGVHILTISLIGGVMLLALIGTITLILETIKDFSISTLVGSLCFGVLFAGSLSLTINDILEGPEVEYTAIVTDYNEVYSQGYEIVRHEGKLVILTKE